MNLLLITGLVAISLCRANPIKEFITEVGSTTETKSNKKGAGKPDRRRAAPRKMLPLTMVPTK